MRILGIDWGKAWLGIAVSDPNGGIAFPRPALKNDGSCMAKLKEITEKDEVGFIVIGLPVNDNGTESVSSAAVRAFGDKLKKLLKKDIIFFDERHTTRIAAENLKPLKKDRREMKKIVDSASAALILQDYLDAQGRK